MNTLENAIMLTQRGYAVHWVRPRSKAPIANGWSTAPAATVTELRQSWRPGYNLGVRCGHWSKPLPEHGLVIIDVDIHRADAASAVDDALAGLIEDTAHVPTVLSGSGMGGRHLWYACPVDALPSRANITLARAEERMPDTQQWVWQIELFSTGKHVVAPPSIHPSGQRYGWLSMPITIPLLPVAVHTAVSETRAAAMPTAQAIPTTSTAGRMVRRGPQTDGHRPGDDFNRRADWTSILAPHGWVPVEQHGDMTYWRRPGKGVGISATINYAGSGLLYVYSTNAAPLEDCTAYTPFAAYALLEHGGNFAAAARTLGGQGYGSQGHPTNWRTIPAQEVPSWR
jgi:hypothetical protein